MNSVVNGRFLSYPLWMTFQINLVTLGLELAMTLPFSLIQDALETVPLCPNLSISGRNMHRMRTDGKSTVQLAKVAHRTMVCVMSGRNYFLPS